MSRHFHLSRFDLAVLVINLVCFGVSLMALVIQGASALVIAILAPTLVMSVAKIGQGFAAEKQSAAL